ncbi:MAG TPA: hypothetical protein VG013_26965 [Gemmataceae bacterium]|jgi:hypothetical protein|nr:hypothetical protein [Gemmataceae bacterium]
MAFDWQSYLELARSLQGQAGTSSNAEAWLRSALSRAYYGAFCYARNYARDWLKFEPRNDPEDHGRLRAHLKGKRRKGDADRLERLRQWRNDSDYLDELTFDLQLVVPAALDEAAKVIASLAPPRSS